MNVGDYPGLRGLAWQTDSGTATTEIEALNLYERGFRHLDQQTLTDRDRAFVQHLAVTHRLRGRANQALALVVHLCLDDVELRFVTVATAFQAPQHATVEDLAIEAWFPVDDATADVMRGLADAG